MYGSSEYSRLKYMIEGLLVFFNELEGGLDFGR